MLKWLLVAILVGLASAHPGVYDEYSYDDKEGEDDGDYLLYYDEDEEEEPDIDDEELKKITDLIANTSYEDDQPQKSGGGKGKGLNKVRPNKNKQRTRRSVSKEEPVPRGQKGPIQIANRKAQLKHREAATLQRYKRGLLDSIIRPDKIILPIIKEIFKEHPRPLTKEQRDKISGGFMGWQYAILDEDCCTCGGDNTCSCCPSTNLTGTDCLKFSAEPNRAQVSLDIGTSRHMQITVAKNSRSMSCEHANLKDICLYSDSFTTSDHGYKACVIITNNVKDPKAGVIKCINYTDGKTSISDS